MRELEGMILIDGAGGRGRIGRLSGAPHIGPAGRAWSGAAAERTADSKALTETRGEDGKENGIC